MSANTLPRDSNNVLPQKDESVPVTELVQVGCCQKLITKEIVESLAIEKYRANGKGITIEDITTKCSIKKSKAQRSLKYFYSNRVLFTAKDFIREGINLLQNKNPQEYFATCMKAEILENLKKRKSVLVEPTGVNLLKHSKSPLSNAVEYEKAHTFLEAVEYENSAFMNLLQIRRHLLYYLLLMTAEAYVYSGHILPLQYCQSILLKLEFPLP